MILSEYDRRWAEIRLYHFCLDMYRIRNKSIDIMDMVNMVCEIGEILGMTRQGVSKYLNRNEEEFSPLPRLNIDDDRLIIKFLITLDKLKDVGQLGYGTFN